MELPEELVCEIMCHLDHSDLGHLTQSCRDFYRIGSEEKIWKQKGFLKRKADIAFAAGKESTPAARLCHTAVTHKDKMYVFGGHNTEVDSQRFSEVKSDLHSYDFISRTWEKVPIAQMPQKTEHSTVVHDGKLYMYGGYSGHSFSNTMFMLNLSTSSQCVEVKNKGDIMTGRSAHVGIVFEDKYYIFGGWDGTVQNNDFFAFDFKKSTWGKVAAENPPHARCSHTGAVSVARKTLYIFGGFGGKVRNYLSDMWSFNFETQTWSEITPRGDIPSPRSRMKMVEWKDKLYIFGGWDKRSHFDELFEFDIETSTWSKIDFGVKDDTYKIGQFSMSLHDNILYIFGGYSAKEKKSTNDLFYMRIGSSKQEDVERSKKHRHSRYELSNAMDVTY